MSNKNQDKDKDENLHNLLNRTDQSAAGPGRKRKSVICAAALVCGLCLAAALGVGIWQSGLPDRPDAPIQENVPGRPDASIQETVPGRPDAPIQENVPNQPDAPSQGAGSPSAGNGSSSPAEEEYAVYTDSVMLPENPSGAAGDMLGCVVYKGKVYRQSDRLMSVDYPALAERLVGEYIGEAKGTLEEWSTQEEWATELASTYSGPVYRVKGYSEDFRLCIEVNSGTEKWLVLFDNYDGIGLNTGADLFEDRLHIAGHVESVTYRTHSDWKEGGFHYQDLTGVTSDQLEQFLTELCKSPFVRITYEDYPDFYNGETEGHLYLNMKDGTVTGLRLVEDGYVGVGYDSLGGIFVKMPGELFDLVFAACQ